MVEGLSRRLARAFCEKITTGQWPVGERVPTTRELAAEYGVSVNTIQTAFRELEATDLVERRPRLGGFVKNRPGRPVASSRATTIAVIAHHDKPDATGTWADRIIRGLGRELTAAGFHIAIFSYAETDPAALTKVLGKIDEAGDTLAGRPRGTATPHGGEKEQISCPVAHVVRRHSHWWNFSSSSELSRC